MLESSCGSLSRTRTNRHGRCSAPWRFSFVNVDGQRYAIAIVLDKVQPVGITLDYIVMEWYNVA